VAKDVKGVSGLGMRPGNVYDVAGDIRNRGSVAKIPRWCGGTLGFPRRAAEPRDYLHFRLWEWKQCVTWSSVLFSDILSVLFSDIAAEQRKKILI